MSTPDERKGHKQETQIRVHCIYATDGRQTGEVKGERFFLIMGQIYTCPPEGYHIQMSLLTQNHMPQVN